MPSKAEGFNLFDIKPTTRDIAILHPATGEPVGLTITFQSIDTPSVQAIIRSITDRRLKLAQRGKPFSSEEIEENGIAIMVAMATGWKFTDPNLQFGADKQPEFTKANAAELFHKLPWLREQLDGELGDKAGFFQK